MSLDQSHIPVDGRDDVVLRESRPVKVIVVPDGSAVVVMSGILVVKRKVDRGDHRQQPGKDRQDFVRHDGPRGVRVPPRKRVDCW